MMEKPEISDVYNIEEVVKGHRLKFISMVRQPLVLVSQVQRSGGTLLIQLLDGHPQLHVHPSELHIGRPNKYYWPELDMRESPEKWFEDLWEHTALLHARDGYSKTANPKYKEDILPFVFLYNLQRDVFLKSVSMYGAGKRRDVIDAYATSYFNAWLDYQGIYRDPDSVLYWTGFVPRLTNYEQMCSSFFRDYPDGKLISILREPVSWYASARVHQPSEYEVVEKAVQIWNQSTQAIIRNRKEYGRRMLAIDFENLLGNTPDAMKRIAIFLGIEMCDSLLFPTFNSLPIKSNTSFTVTSYGIIKQPMNRSKQVSPKERKYIERRTAEIYNECQGFLAEEVSADKV